jgi:hypothetical protein
VSADPKSGQVTPGSYVHVRPRQSLVRAAGWAALLTGAVAAGVATELHVAGTGWLAWLALALPPAAAGGVCLARRPVTISGPAAVFASCTAAGSIALQIPQTRYGLVLATSLLLLLCAGVSVIISGTITLVTISNSGAISPRRAAVWIAVALVFAALSIPYPVYVPGGPIQTIFTGNTGGQDAVLACALVLLAVPLVVTGLAPGRMATILAVAWLPEAATPLLGFLSRPNIVHLDAWYYATWLAWLAIVVLTLAEARRR